MKKKTIICDICNKEIKSNRLASYYEIKQKFMLFSDLFTDKTLDVCDICVAKIISEKKNE